MHKGTFGIVPKELDGFSSSSGLLAFDVSEKCDPEWINYFLRQGDFYLSLIDIAKGAAAKRIQPKSLFEVRIPLSEISIQKKIIKKFISQEEKTKIIDSEIQTQKQLLTNSNNPFYKKPYKASSQQIGVHITQIQNLPASY